jgi:hypothetical protein
MSKELDMSELNQEIAAARRATLSWGIAFFASMFGVIAASLFFDVNSAISVALLFAAMLLLVPFVRSAERGAQLRGCGSNAMRRYNRRIMIASFVYVITLFGAIWLSRIGTYPTPIYVMIAAAPSFPVVAMIWTMGRLLVEETDEYLRSRQIHHALMATGFILAASTLWGFLEQFNLVPHIAAYWVFPVWAVSLGLSQCWSAVRP